MSATTHSGRTESELGLFCKKTHSVGLKTGLRIKEARLLNRKGVRRRVEKGELLDSGVELVDANLS